MEISGFSANQFLREINFGVSRSSKSAIFVFLEDLTSARKHQTHHFYRLKNDQSWFHVKSEGQKNIFSHFVKKIIKSDYTRSSICRIYISIIGMISRKNTANSLFFFWCKMFPIKLNNFRFTLISRKNKAKSFFHLLTKNSSNQIKICMYHTFTEKWNHFLL